MVVIIGAGISGLTLAHRLQQLQVPYTLLEASGRVGGLINTVTDGPYTIEAGPNSLLASPETLNWLAELGLADSVLYASAASKARFILKGGKPSALPQGPLSFLFSNFFSWSTKRKLWAERNNSSKTSPGETVAGFFERRFGREVVDYAVAPFVAGIYAGNAEDMLVAYTFPQLVAWEAQYGSVIKGLMANKGATGRKQSINFQGGMSQLVNAIAKQLNRLRLNTPVKQVLPIPVGGYEVQLGNGETIQAKAVVCCVPTFELAKMIEDSIPELFAPLARVYYPPMVAVHTAFPASAFSKPFTGFGTLHPDVEKSMIRGTIFTSATFAGKAPADQVLMLSFVGGAGHELKTNLNPQLLVKEVVKELSSIYGLTVAPTWTNYFAWNRTIPQFNKAFNALYPLLPAWEARNLYMLSNWKDGVGINDSIQNAQSLARKLKDSQ